MSFIKGLFTGCFIGVLFMAIFRISKDEVFLLWLIDNGCTDLK